MGNPATEVGDRLLAEGIYLGYQWQVTVAGTPERPLPYRCGYVRIPAGHPWHSLPKEEIPARVHGEITYARQRPDGYWIGFHCGYCGNMDVPDSELPGYDPGDGDIVATLIAEGATVKTTEYVESQCKQLIRQARIRG